MLPISERLRPNTMPHSKSAIANATLQPAGSPVRPPPAVTRTGRRQNIATEPNALNSRPNVEKNDAPVTTASAHFVTGIENGPRTSGPPPFNSKPSSARRGRPAGHSNTSPPAASSRVPGSVSSISTASTSTSTTEQSRLGSVSTSPHRGATPVVHARSFGAATTKTLSSQKSTSVPKWPRHQARQPIVTYPIRKPHAGPLKQNASTRLLALPKHAAPVGASASRDVTVSPDKCNRFANQLQSTQERVGIESESLTPVTSPRPAARLPAVSESSEGGRDSLTTYSQAMASAATIKGVSLGSSLQAPVKCYRRGVDEAMKKKIEAAAKELEIEHLVKARERLTSSSLQKLESAHVVKKLVCDPVATAVEEASKIPTPAAAMGSTRTHVSITASEAGIEIPTKPPRRRTSLNKQVFLNTANRTVSFDNRSDVLALYDRQLVEHARLNYEVIAEIARREGHEIQLTPNAHASESASAFSAPRGDVGRLEEMARRDHSTSFVGSYGKGSERVVKTVADLNLDPINASPILGRPLPPFDQLNSNSLKSNPLKLESFRGPAPTFGVHAADINLNTIVEEHGEAKNEATEMSKAVRNEEAAPSVPATGLSSAHTATLHGSVATPTQPPIQPQAPVISRPCAVPGPNPKRITAASPHFTTSHNTARTYFSHAHPTGTIAPNSVTLSLPTRNSNQGSQIPDSDSSETVVVSLGAQQNAEIKEMQKVAEEKMKVAEEGEQEQRGLRRKWRGWRKMIGKKISSKDSEEA